MKDDYLWDKSGEPDPDVQQLEQILGTLRYQPRELEIPAPIQSRRRNYIRGLAVAAALAMVVIGLGVWRATNKTPKPVVAENQPRSVEKVVVQPGSETNTLNVEQSRPSDKNSSVAVSTPRRRSPRIATTNRPVTVQPKLSESELAEAKAAKDQLILALRVASSKLNQVQKRTQGNNETHNQHKTG